MIMKKWLSHFAYNQRSRSGWTLSTHLKNTSKSNLIGKKTVTYVPGTFVTLVPGPNTSLPKGDFPELIPLFDKEGLGEIFLIQRIAHMDKNCTCLCPFVRSS